MPDFFDQLWEQLHNPRNQRERLQYIEHLKTLIPMSPRPRSWQLKESDLPRHGYALHSLEQCDPDKWNGPADFLLFDLSLGEVDPASFRKAKERVEGLPFWRLDPLYEESKVLETRAMGADAYCLDMSQLDLASAQFLVELGRDYDIPAVLCCSHEEELALALQIQDVDHFWLQGILCVPQLIDLDGFRNKKIIFEVESQLEILKFPLSSSPSIAFVQRVTGTP